MNLPASVSASQVAAQRGSGNTASSPVGFSVSGTRDEVFAKVGDVLAGAPQQHGALSNQGHAAHRAPLRRLEAPGRSVLLLEVRVDSPHGLGAAAPTSSASDSV